MRRTGSAGCRGIAIVIVYGMVLVACGRVRHDGEGYAIAPTRRPVAADRHHHVVAGGAEHLPAGHAGHFVSNRYATLRSFSNESKRIVTDDWFASVLTLNQVRLFCKSAEILPDYPR